MYDILIKNGTIIDGTGRKRFKADAAVKNGLIYEIGDLKGETARSIVDATGKYVTPGFVDVDNHSDTYCTLLQYPKAESLVYQGITTIIGGGCGSSLAPLVGEETIRSIQKWANIDRVNINWDSMAEYLEYMGSLSLGINYATLVGHSTLRRAFVGDEARALTAEEQKSFIQLLENSLKEGAAGMSTGLMYAHGRPASKEELVDLARMVHAFDGVYTTHIRNEMDTFVSAVQEALDVMATTNVKMHISHLKVVGERYWSLFDEALNRIDEEGRIGSEVSFSIFPYTVSGSVLYTLLPNWLTNEGKITMLKRLEDWQARREAIEDIRRKQLDYTKIHISIAGHEATFSGDSIADISQHQRLSPEDVILNLIISNKARVIVFMDLLYEENIRKALTTPYSIITTDGAGYSVEHKYKAQRIHPRSFGAFPRVLAQYVREQKVLTWEKAIYKMTGFPARKFGLKKRGILHEDTLADILVLDPKRVQDNATFENPYRYASGVECVIMNGKVVLEGGKHTGVMAGKVLRRA